MILHSTHSHLEGYKFLLFYQVVSLHTPQNLCYRGIAEIVERILFQTDMRSLLTAAQRVCHNWCDIINRSCPIQTNLFFEPRKVKPIHDQHRTMNPLIHNIWHDFFRREGHLTPKYFKPLNPVKEIAYLRPEASWRYMLPFQLPTYRMGIIEWERNIFAVDFDSPEFTEVGIKMDHSYLRLGHLQDQVEGIHGSIVPGQDVLVFWEDAGCISRKEWELYFERALVESTYRKTCDVVIFCSDCYQLNRHEDAAVLTPVDHWLVGAEKFKINKHRWRVSIRYERRDHEEVGDL